MFIIKFCTQDILIASQSISFLMSQYYICNVGASNKYAKLRTLKLCSEILCKF